MGVSGVLINNFFVHLKKIPMPSANNFLTKFFTNKGSFSSFFNKACSSITGSASAKSKYTASPVLFTPNPASQRSFAALEATSRGTKLQKQGIGALK